MERPTVELKRYPEEMHEARTVDASHVRVQATGIAAAPAQSSDFPMAAIELRGADFGAFRMLLRGWLPVANLATPNREASRNKPRSIPLASGITVIA